MGIVEDGEWDEAGSPDEYTLPRVKEAAGGKCRAAGALSSGLSGDLEGWHGGGGICNTTLQISK